MEQFFKSIFEFLSSPQFTAAMASLLGAWTIIYPIINKVVKVRTDLKVTRLTAQLQTRTSEFKELQEQILAFGRLTDGMAQTVKELKQNAVGQNEAMLTAFSNSNLKQDVKSYISGILEIKDSLLDAAEPIVSDIKEVIENDTEEELIEFERA